MRRAYKSLPVQRNWQRRAIYSAKISLGFLAIIGFAWFVFSSSDQREELDYPGQGMTATTVAQP